MFMHFTLFLLYLDRQKLIKNIDEFYQECTSMLSIFV